MREVVDAIEAMFSPAMRINEQMRRFGFRTPEKDQ